MTLHGTSIMQPCLVPSLIATWHSALSGLLCTYLDCMRQHQAYHSDCSKTEEDTAGWSWFPSWRAVGLQGTDTMQP